MTEVTLKMIESGKRLQKIDLAWELHEARPMRMPLIAYSFYTRAELIEMFNTYFNISIK